MTEGIIIQARTGSTRLHNKILLPFYNGSRIIDILIGSIKNAFPDKVIVLATTHRDADDVLAEVAKEAGVHCFRGEEDNVLDRFIHAAKDYHIDRLIRVCSDNPFLQIHSFTELFAVKGDYDYVAYGFADGTPTIKTHLGFYPELTTLDALQRAACYTQEKIYREHVTNYLYTHPGEFSIRLLALPDVLEQRRDLRFTLDTTDDFNLLKEIYQLHKEETDGSLTSLLGLIESNPVFKEKMMWNISMNEK